MQPTRRLIATSIRINSRPPARHLVDTRNALRTLCGCIIDPQTWEYRGANRDDPTCQLCKKYETEIRP